MANNVVRELITRLSFRSDMREADKYDKKLKDIEKKANKQTKDAEKRLALVGKQALAEKRVTDLQAARAKAIQDAQKRAAQLEAQRAQMRQRAADADHRRALRSQAQADRLARAARTEQANLANARRVQADAAALRAARLAEVQSRTNSRARKDEVNLQQLRSRGHMRDQAHRVAMEQSQRRAGAFELRQSALRRQELLREQRLQQLIARGHGTRAAGRAGGGLGGFFGPALAVGGGVMAAMPIMHRIDEQATAVARMNMEFSRDTELSRSSRIRDIAMTSGLNTGVLADVAYKTQRSASSIGITGMTEGRALDIAEAIATNAALSGSSPEATNAALIQLFQGIESNRLGGEELRSVMEQVPTLARTLVEQGGLKDLAELRKKSQAGEITGKFVLDALEKSLPEVRAKAGQIPITFARTFAQVSTIFNSFLLDMQRGANITGKFNDAVLGLVKSMESGVRLIVSRLGGWESATQSLVAVMGGVAIPLIAKLAFGVARFAGPMALIAIPLSLVLDSIMNFAKQFPEEWSSALKKLKDAFGYFFESVMYALGVSLKPFRDAKTTKMATIPLENVGNGVVRYKGKEYNTSDPALSQAIFADNPMIGDAVRRNGGRVRIMENGNLLAELQSKTGGAKAGFNWAEAIEKFAKSVEEFSKTITTIKDKFDQLGITMDRFLGFVNSLYKVVQAIMLLPRVMFSFLPGGDMIPGIDAAGARKQLEGILQWFVTPNAALGATPEQMRGPMAMGGLGNVTVEIKGISVPVTLAPVQGESQGDLQKRVYGAVKEGTKLGALAGVYAAGVEDTSRKSR
ncbi:tape measure protein [Pseudomonas phage MiCath]|uniref:Tape measure protein n=1 Tax=Pseudomonas phage MiCath TaxID=3003729 RepID=A0AAE9VLL6_9CAUD|nr:tape measure protein [Pseudomonas phage MiCath]WAX22427.1 tape measure protein [Pseudomonas phage MiCath]